MNAHDEDPLAPEEDHPAANLEWGLAIYCEECEMWLNGGTQWEDHKIGKKHKKNVKKADKTAKVQAKKVKGR